MDISYRPIRIAWVINSHDFAAFRYAVRATSVLSGGRSNPIVFADRGKEAEQIIDLFRPDILIPIGSSSEVREFPSKYPYLITPSFHDEIFVNYSNGKRAWVLDVISVFASIKGQSLPVSEEKNSLHITKWHVDDPLSDVFLAQYGGLPSAEEAGAEYDAMFSRLSEGREFNIELNGNIPGQSVVSPGCIHVSTLGLERLGGRDSGWRSPGYFFGSSDDLEDLACFWNIRAAGVSLVFVDPKYPDRFTDQIAAWGQWLEETKSHRPEWNRDPALWSRTIQSEDLQKLIPDRKYPICNVSEHLWNGLNLKTSLMQFGQTSVLGVLGDDEGCPKVSFPLNDLPISDIARTNTQQFVASMSFLGGLYGNETYTLQPPYIPELNEYLSRSMYWDYSKLRIEPERIGILLSGFETDLSIKALPVASLFERILQLSGYRSKPSSSGLITRQVISRLGGLHGVRVFKISGVRRLLKKHGPTDSFLKQDALSTIGQTDPENPEAKFSNHSNLYLEPRTHGASLRPADVVDHLVKKGVFRLGFKLTCPMCSLADWISIDELKQANQCGFCGESYDSSLQLLHSEIHLRRSGIFGKERNALGAIPVALTLHQVSRNIGSGLNQGMYSLSLDLTNALDSSDQCEIDFLWMMPRLPPDKTVLILGECKDQGPINLEAFKKDIKSLGRIANGIPKNRFDVFYLYSKLKAFTKDELAEAKTLNPEHHQKLILLTDRELEPDRIYENSPHVAEIISRSQYAEGFAFATKALFYPAEIDS